MQRKGKTSITEKEKGIFERAGKKARHAGMAFRTEEELLNYMRGYVGNARQFEEVKQIIEQKHKLERVKKVISGKLKNQSGIKTKRKIRGRR